MERLQPYLPGMGPTELPAPTLWPLRAVEENNNYLLYITAEGIKNAIPKYKGMDTASYGPPITTCIDKENGKTVYFHLIATRQSVLFQNGSWQDLVVSLGDDEKDAEEDQNTEVAIVYVYTPRLPMLLEGKEFTTKYDKTSNLWLTRDSLDI